MTSPNTATTFGASPVTCFTPGTAITTTRGLKPVLDLREGDRVLTRDRGFQPVVWIGARALDATSLRRSPDMHPVRIRAGALGNGLPEKDMIVSPRHRMLTCDPRLTRDTGETEILIEAAALVGQPGIDRVRARQLTYCHILFEQHEIILSDNTWSESFHISGPTLTALQDNQSAELLTLFPALADSQGAALPRLARKSITVEDAPRLTLCA